MRHALSRASRVPLGEFTRSRLLVAFDYDGTLAPITDDPANAPMRAGTRDLLAALCQRYPCAVISGRAREDVELLVTGVGLRAVAGNHGAELPGLDAPPESADVGRWRATLAVALAGLDGVRIEDKHLSLSVHYRAAKDKDEARRAIGDAARSLESVRVVGGKDVVNLVPRGARHKGFALDELRRGESCEAALYVGDDETDEDVFKMRRALRLLTIRVGEKQDSDAEFYVETQEEVDALISALLELRPA
ncbi:MAG TPA: trehalose-phosphatase [Polyangiaceae bacterium]|jgi:trehalose 6-phosphate phosphatase|nr:trehalose-phosphatase [Polyangiaceae bacterium]